MNVSDHLKQLEEALLSNAVRKDPAQLSQLLAVDFREIGSSGRIFSRAEMLRELGAESILRSSTLSDFTHTQLSDTVALVTYRTVRSSPGASFSEALRSSVWVFRDSRWQILFHQGTRLL